MRAQLLTGVSQASPGQTVPVRVRVATDDDLPGRFSVRIHGMQTGNQFVELPPPPTGRGQYDLTLPVLVPPDCPEGDHMIALELRRETAAGRQQVMLSSTVSVGRSAGLAVRIVPDVIRGHGWTRFAVEVSNHGSRPATVQLTAEGPSLQIQLRNNLIGIGPGEVARVSARVRAAGVHGEVNRHPLTVSAAANGRPVHANAMFEQRAVVAPRVRSVVTALAIVAVWAMVLGGALLWWNASRDKLAGNFDTTSATAAPGAGGPAGAPGSGGTPGQPGAPGQPGQPGGGTGGGSGTGGGGGGGGGTGGTPGAAAAAPTSTIVRGTVSDASSGAASGVMISLLPLSGSATDAAAQNPVSSGWRAPSNGEGAGTPVKAWPARSGVYPASHASMQRTFSLSSSASSKVDGTWSFSNVPLARTFEVTLAKAGYQTQSFVVFTKPDGKPITLDVVLQPGVGSLSGRVGGPNGPVGGAQVTITDGTTVIHTSTSTVPGHVGEWSVDHLSTPATYTVTITKDGLSTEVLQRRLGPGESASGVNVDLSPGLGSIGGLITDRNGPLPGATVSVAAGDSVVTTTSLSEGAKGTYHLPRLPLGATYTITVSAPGYLTQSRSVSLSTANANVGEINFTLTATTGSVIGQILGFNADTNVTAPLVSAGITVSGGGLEVRTQSAAAPDAGAFSVNDLPPGSYLVTAVRYDHSMASTMVNLGAGDIVDVGQITLTYHPPAVLQAIATVTVRTVDPLNKAVTGVTVELVDMADKVVMEKTMTETESTVVFTEVPIGTYSVRGRKVDAGYRTATSPRFSVGQAPIEKELKMVKFGSARGTVIDALGGTTSTPQLDSLKNPVYNVVGTDTLVYFDPNTPLNPAPDLPCRITPGTTLCEPPTSVYRDPTGLLIGKYPSNELVRWPDVNDATRAEILDPRLVTTGKKQLDGYRLLLYAKAGTTLSCLKTLSPEPADVDGNIFWQIDPNEKLLPGDYVLRFAPPSTDTSSICRTAGGQIPIGYAPPTTTDGSVAKFTIVEGLDQGIVVEPIRMWQYPSVVATVVAPTWDGQTVSYNAPADVAGAQVTLTCGAVARSFTLSASNTATFDPPAVAGIFPSAVGSPGATLGDCTIAATAPGRIAGQSNLTLAFGARPAPDTDPAVPGNYSSYARSLALVTSPKEMVGQVRWIDPAKQDGTSYAYASGTVTSTQTIVGFNQPTDSGQPTTVEQTLSSDIDSGGWFYFRAPDPQQVLGDAEYTFAPTDGATPVTLKVQVDGTSPWVVKSDPAPSTWTVDGSNLLTVYVSPKPGTLRVPVTVVSWATKAHIESELSVAPTSDAPGCTLAPTAVSVDPLPTTMTRATDVTYASACAGTWTVAAQASAGNDFMAIPDPQTGVVNPAATWTTAQMSVVDLGGVKVHLVDELDNPVAPSDGVTVRLAPNAAPTVVIPDPMNPAPAPVEATSMWDPPGVPPSSQLQLDPLSTDGTVRFAKMPVDSGFDGTHFVETDPGQTPVVRAPFSYSLDVLLDPTKVDPAATLSATVTDATTASVIPDFNSSTYDDAGVRAGIPVVLVYGTDVEVTIKIPVKTKLYGTVKGKQAPAGANAGLKDLAGVAITTSPATANATTSDTGGYEIAATRATTYDVTATPGQGTYYVPATKQVTVSGVDPVELNFELECELRELTITANDGKGGTVSGAKVELWWGADLGITLGDPNQAGATPRSADYPAGTTDASGVFKVSVCRGTYTVLITKRDATGDLNYPVLVDFDAAAGSVLTVEMPSPVGVITGTATFTNSDATPFPSTYYAPPSDPKPQMSVTYTAMDTSVGPNRAVAGDLATDRWTKDLTWTATDQEKAVGTYHFELDSLFLGTYVLTPPKIPGFTLDPTSLPSSVSFDATGAQQTPVNLIYLANKRDLDVHVIDSAAAAITGAQVSITATSATPTELADPAGVYRFTGLDPSPSYQLTADKAGYVGTTQAVAITPDTGAAPGTAATATVKLYKPTTISGNVTCVNATGETPGCPTSPTVTLEKESEPVGGTWTQVDTFTVQSDTYTFTIGTPGNYRVTVTQDGYLGDQRSFTGLGLEETKTADLTLKKLAKITNVPHSPAMNPTGTVNGTDSYFTPGIEYTITTEDASHEKITYVHTFEPGESVPFATAFPYAQVTVDLVGAPPGVVVQVGATPGLTPTNGAITYYVKAGDTTATATGTNAETLSDTKSATATTPAAFTFTWSSLNVKASGGPTTVATTIGRAGTTVLTSSSLPAAGATFYVKPGATYTVAVSGTDAFTLSKAADLTTATSASVAFTWYAQTLRVELSGKWSGGMIVVCDSGNVCLTGDGLFQDPGGPTPTAKLDYTFYFRGGVDATTNATYTGTATVDKKSLTKTIDVTNAGVFSFWTDATRTTATTATFVL